MKHVAIATCADFPSLGPYDRYVLAKLEERGVKASPVILSDPSIRWEAFDLVVVHSTWDSHLQTTRFLEWVAQRSSSLRNSSSLIWWNIHKRYLRDLADAGVATVATLWIDKGNSVDIEARLNAVGWDVAVLKPAISATGHNTHIIARSDIAKAQRRCDDLTASADVMIQPYQRAFETIGETSLIYFNGAFSHAVRRPPTLATVARGFTEPHVWKADARERAVADAAMACLAERPLHARVDLVETNDGGVAVQELEAIEPCLFTALSPGGADRFADAILAHI